MKYSVRFVPYEVHVILVAYCSQVMEGWTRNLDGGNKNEHTILVRKPFGKRPLEIVRWKWEDNTKLGHSEGGCESVNWIELA
jgi:hypothetical protein